MSAENNALILKDLQFCFNFFFTKTGIPCCREQSCIQNCFEHLRSRLKVVNSFLKKAPFLMPVKNLDTHQQG